MAIALENHGPKISDEAVRDLERYLGASLPTEYREFLLAYNGGTPVLDTIDIPGFAESPTDVQVFFGLDRSIESSTFQWKLEVLKERLRQLGGGLLPIACDSMGNIFCLSLRRHDHGAVLYCDLDAVFADLTSAPPSYLVTQDFEEFLRKLRAFDPDPTQSDRQTSS